MLEEFIPRLEAVGSLAALAKDENPRVGNLKSVCNSLYGWQQVRCCDYQTSFRGFEQTIQLNFFVSWIRSDEHRAGANDSEEYQRIVDLVPVIESSLKGDLAYY